MATGLKGKGRFFGPCQLHKSQFSEVASPILYMNGVDLYIEILLLSCLDWALWFYLCSVTVFLIDKELWWK